MPSTELYATRIGCRPRELGTAEGALMNRLSATVGMTAGATLAMGGVAHAACTCTVDSLQDPPETGHTTLRDAITSANANPGSTITFTSGLTGTVTLGSNLITILQATDIEGPGPGTITINGNGHQIFYVDSASSSDHVRIAGLTITGGSGTPTGEGGGIYNETGDLTVAGDVITQNTPTGNGGGINSRDNLTVLDSTISNNTSANQGGGIDADTGPSLTIRNSTISGNTGRDIGGIFVEDTSGAFTLDRYTVSGNTGDHYGGGIGVYRVGAPSTISNSTIAGNHANGPTVDSGYAGGIDADQYTPHLLTIVGSTIAGNTGVLQGGGLNVYTGTNHEPAVLENTIVAGNTAPTGPDISGPVQAAFSLIQNTAGATVTNNVVGSNLTGQDPQLGALASNGGSTQ